MNTLQPLLPDSEPRQNPEHQNSGQGDPPKSHKKRLRPKMPRIYRFLVGGIIFFLIIFWLYLIFSPGGWIWPDDEDDEQSQYNGMSGLKLPTLEKLKRVPQDQQPIDTLQNELLFGLTLSDSTLQLYYPPAGQQGKQASCTAFSVGYALISYYEKRRGGYSYDTGPSGLPSPSKVFSPAFIYNALCSGNCEEGIEFVDAFDHVRDNGICKWADFGYDGTKLKCTPLPGDATYTKASAFLGYRFFSVKRSFNKFMDYLDAGIPLIIGIYTSETMYKDGLAAEKKTRYYWNPAPDDMLDYHAMLCVAYDKATESFILLNSWGPNWGTHGYCFIRKELFMSRYREVYIARLDRPKVTPEKTTTKIDTSFFVEILATKPIVAYDSIAANHSNFQLDSLFRSDYQTLRALDTTLTNRKALMRKLERYISN